MVWIRTYELPTFPLSTAMTFHDDSMKLTLSSIDLIFPYKRFGLYNSLSGYADTHTAVFRIFQIRQVESQSSKNNLIYLSEPPFPNLRHTLIEMRSLFPLRSFF
jgi:hypothetical protein